MASKQTDGAFLLWARDWLTDERVALMSPAAKGVFIDLLAHAWLEGSIPACSEHRARIVRVDVAMLEQLWRELGPLWVEHPTEPGRLVNPRQEREREQQQARRKSRVDKATKAANDRWEKKRAQRAGNAQGGARPMLQASPQALLQDAHQTKPSTTPLPPRGEGPASGSEGLRSLRSHPAPAGATDRVVEELTDALLATRYRAGIAVPVARRSAVRASAVRLRATGIEPEHVERLAELAAAKSNGDAGALLAHWLDGEAPMWRSVLDEQLMKQRELGLRVTAASDDADVSMPKPAASVLDGILNQARTTA